MKLVIDIPEDTYNYMISRCKYQNKDDSGLSEFEKAGIAIKNGTPLPKVYGDLVDRDKVIDLLNEQEYNYYTELDKVVDTVYEAEAIIAADKGEQE